MPNERYGTYASEWVKHSLYTLNEMKLSDRERGDRVTPRLSTEINTQYILGLIQITGQEVTGYILLFDGYSPDIRS